MLQIKPFSDRRFDSQCAYCGKHPDTFDHVPSKILLEKPYPENLQGVNSCLSCNNGFSLDEEYFACLIECVICGSSDPNEISRPKIAKILNRKPKLRARFEESLFKDVDQTIFKIESERLENVLRKLSFGHAKYQNSETRFDEPTRLWYAPIASLSDDEREAFFANVELDIAPEIGSRSFQEMYLNGEGQPVSNWTVVQDNIYAYSVITDLSAITVRILIRDYLICETIWRTS